MSTQITRLHEPSAIRTIFLTAFVAGSLDMAGAIIVYAIAQHKTTAIKIMQYIASSILGAKAFSGGLPAALLGLLIHYTIAFCFAAVYFFIFPHIIFLKKYKVASGLLYGVFVWLVMNLVAVPLVFAKSPTFTIPGFLTGAIILMVAIGLPIAFMTERYYAQNQKIH